MRFEFATATRIVFGPGTARELGGIVAGLGSRTLIVTGSHPERWAHVTMGLPAAASFCVAGEPSVWTVREGVKAARQHAADVVVAVGGGSAIDTGKAVAALLANPGDPLDYLEVAGRGQPLMNPSLPFVAAPTTAGTGAEVTRNSVLQCPEHQVKASLRSPHLLPQVALVDPELTFDLPEDLTASTGLDALTQLIEAYVTPKANPVTDALCQDGIRRAARALPRAFEDGRDAEAREEMALASLFGGLALANAGLGAVHGFAAPIGGKFEAPHGAVCAALLPHVVEANLAAGAAVERYTSLARLLTGDSRARGSDAVPWLHELTHRLRVRRLRSYGVQPSDIPGLVELAAKASSMKANPVILSTEVLKRILESAW